MTTETIVQSETPKPYANTWQEWVAVFLFWSWNLIFLAFMSLGFGPTLLPETFTAVRTGMIPVNFLLYALVLALIPVGAVVLGLTVLRRAPMRQLALGYVVEGPLMLLLAVRFFLIRQATPGTTAVMIIALLGIAAFLWDVLSPCGTRWPGLRLFGLSLMVMVALYAALWIAFYALPLGAYALNWVQVTLANLPLLFKNISRDLTSIIRETPYLLGFTVIGFILFLYTATLFVVAPIAIPTLSLTAWVRSLKENFARFGFVRPVVMVSLAFLGASAIFFLSNRQPQGRAFSMLEQPPSSPAQAQELLKRSESIRAGLLNAYLAPFRYISAQGEVRHVSEIYVDALHLPREQAFRVQAMYERVAAPLLYQPIHRAGLNGTTTQQALTDEPGQAARLYQRFFDTPITVGERPTIVNAARSTWSGDQAEAAWQAVDDREVRLVSQDITTRPQGDYAELELHEVYQNQTARLQEVVYYFSLPESAVITGLWMGPTADKDAAYEFQVAPRGAAQAVYREQTRIMKDPALVEQIGPRQYRLRVYPIPAMNVDYDQQTGRSSVREADQVHLWLAWREMAVPTENGPAWPLPQLAEVRNVYWDEGTQRTADGSTDGVALPTDNLPNGTEGWLPAALPATDAASAAPAAHRFDLPGGDSVLALPEGQIEPPSLPGSLRLAVVLDRSRSMEALRQETAEALEEIRQSLGDQPVDVYLTASPYRGEEPSLTSLDLVDPEEVIYFGGQNAASLLAQFQELQGDHEYDAVLVLTDGSGYELGEGWAELQTPTSPVWLVHLGEDLPLGYDDQTLEAVQASGGGVAGDVQTALGRLAFSLASQENSADAPAADLIDGYLWRVVPTGQADSILPAGASAVHHDPGDAFAALAARRLILAETQRNRGSLDQLDSLDRLHALAVQTGVVTPYSSMIVLVNSQQQQLLEDLSNLEDRYTREVEAVGETTTRSPVPLTGVPEPHEWLLLGLAAAFLIYLGYTKKAKELAGASTRFGR